MAEMNARYEELLQYTEVSRRSQEQVCSQVWATWWSSSTTSNMRQCHTGQHGISGMPRTRNLNIVFLNSPTVVQNQTLMFDDTNNIFVDVLFSTVVNTTARHKVYNCIVPVTTSMCACVRCACVRGPLTFSKSLSWPSIQKGCRPLL